MKELIEKIRKVSVKAEDDIEAELLNAHHYQKLDQALLRVVEDIEELMQTTRNTNHHLVNPSEGLDKVKFELTNKEQIKSVHEKLGHLLVYLEKKEVTKRIRGVTVKAEDDIEAELFEKTLQRVVHDVEGLMQITRNTDNNNPTVGGSSDVKDAMVGRHSEELKEGISFPFGGFIRLDDSRWLSLKVAIPDFNLEIASGECRSILCFNLAVNCDREWFLEADFFKKLRVLDLSKINFMYGMPPDITDLIFLRYLALASCKVLNCITLWKNWNLQTLIVTEDDNGARRLPPGIWDLPQLRHLEIYHQISIDCPKAIQEDLQTLYWLSTSECTMEVFSRITNVKELGIIAKCKVASSVSQGLDNLCCLEHLEKLKVMGSYRRPLRLPPQANNFPQNLQKLTFVRTLIPWEAMSIISMLPNLVVLKLKNFACVGQHWELSQEGGFPQLKVLLISFTNLKEGKANVDTPFPKLERLLLRNCFELKEMPEWINDIINTLQLIKLEYCYASLVGSAQRIKEEQLDYYGNDKLDVIHSNTRPDDEDHAKEEDRSNEQTCEVKSVFNDLTRLWFKARELRITWGHVSEYWIWTFDSDSGDEVVKLEKVSAFDIGLTFDIRCLNKMSCYSAYLVFKLENGSYEDVYTALAAVRYEKDNARYGWMNTQNWHTNTYVYPNIESVFLAKTKSYGDYGQFPNSRTDGWMEIKLGDFYVSSGKEGEVQLRLWHTSNQHWKSGFVVRGVEIRLAN
nr:putative late blight resistance protein homolog R1B-17 [Ipomoea batatas]